MTYNRSFPRIEKAIELVRDNKVIELEYGRAIVHDLDIPYYVENEDTNDKYCPCSINKGTIRRYDRVGYMEAELHDQMITKKCLLCSAEGLFTLTNSICSACKVLSHYNPD